MNPATEVNQAPAPHIGGATISRVREGLAPGADIVANEHDYGSYNDAPFVPPQLAGKPETGA